MARYNAHMPTGPNKRVKIHLQDLIDARSVTAYRAAIAMGRKPSTLHDVLTGRRGISDDLLVDICDYFKCSAGEVLEVLPQESLAEAN